MVARISTARVVLLLVPVLAFAAGCDGGAGGLPSGRPCDATTPCPVGQGCVAGFCVQRDAGGIDAWGPDVGPDTVLPADVVGDHGNGPDAPVPVDVGADAPEDIGGGADVAPDVPSPVDVPEDTGGPDPGFCRAFSDCPGAQICELSEGRCEVRSSQPDAQLSLLSFHPRAGAPGDRLVVDGTRFYHSMFGSFGVRATIGGTAASTIQADENRLVVTVPANTSGRVVVQGEDGSTPASAESFTATATGVLACDGTTPRATGTPGEAPTASGPHAAGYVDIAGQDLRIFYPAECGGVRRPPVLGEHPLVVVLHGNGALYINYEYLAQILATWGFVTAMPATGTNNEYDPTIVAEIYAIVDAVRDADLEDLHPVLAGVSTSASLAMVGHSRGCARMQNVYDAHSDVSGAALASVFLGPADDGVFVPGLFLVIGATEDGQSFPAYTSNAYDRQSAPRWKLMIQGGNHSLFADHKVYYLFDGTPSITRRQQLEVVLSFTVPLMQRAFGLEEPFADWLDDPPSSALYDLSYDLGI